MPEGSDDSEDPLDRSQIWSNLWEGFEWVRQLKWIIGRRRS
jgi:hypothetical protein